MQVSDHKKIRKVILNNAFTQASCSWSRCNGLSQHAKSALTYRNRREQTRKFKLGVDKLMNRYPFRDTTLRNALTCLAAISLTACGTATFTKTGSDAQIETLRSFQLSFIDEFGETGKVFDSAAFDAKVNQGNMIFEKAIADEKFSARRPMLEDLAEVFKADANHIRSMASRGKMTAAVAGEMIRHVNMIYDHTLGR